MTLAQVAGRQLEERSRVLRKSYSMNHSSSCSLVEVCHVQVETSRSYNESCSRSYGS